MSGTVKINSAGGGSISLTPASTASNVTATVPAATDTLVNLASSQSLSNKTITAANTNTVEATSGPTSTQLAGQRNKIINGAMMIDQRNAGASKALDNLYSYTLDRWGAEDATDGSLTVQQDTVAPNGFSNSLKVTVTSADASLASNQFAYIQQCIEGTNVPDLMFGTASASSITISFWVRSSISGTFGGAITNTGATRSYPFSYSITSVNTWEQKTVTIPGDTTGTWLTNNGVGLILRFGFGVGSAYSGTAGSWTSANCISATGAQSIMGTNGATFYITGVQLEKGATATPFENRLYGTELALCQRYYYKLQASGTLSYFANGNVTTTTDAQGLTEFPVAMRTKPTALEQSGTASHYLVQYQSTGATCTSVPTFQTADTWNARTSFTASGLTAGNGAFLRSNNASAYLAWSAEL